MCFSHDVVKWDFLSRGIHTRSIVLKCTVSLYKVADQSILSLFSFPTEPHPALEPQTHQKDTDALVSQGQ